MAKIGTAHVEIKPVLNEEALHRIEERIAEAVRKGVEAGMKAASPPMVVDVTLQGGSLTTDLGPVARNRDEMGGRDD